MLRAQATEASEGRAGERTWEPLAEGSWVPQCHSCLLPFMFGKTVQFPSLSPYKPTRKKITHTRDTQVCPQITYLGTWSPFFSLLSLLKSCLFPADPLQAAPSASSVPLIESLYLCATQAMPSLKERTACLSSVTPIAPSHIVPLVLGSRANQGVNDKCAAMVKLNSWRNGDRAREEKLARPKDMREVIWSLEKPQVTIST